MLVVQTDNPAAEVSVAALAVRSADMAAPARSQWHDQRHKQEPLPEHHDGGVATAAADDIGDDDDDDDDDDDGDVGLGGDDVDLDGDDDVLPMTTIIFRCDSVRRSPKCWHSRCFAATLLLLNYLLCWDNLAS